MDTYVIENEEYQLAVMDESIRSFIALFLFF